jgi:hypothetical protein
MSLAVTVHSDRYDDADLGTAVDTYDTGRNARYAIPREQQRSPEVFGPAAFYGWSEDKARQATVPEGQSFPAYLRARGFNFE